MDPKQELAESRNGNDQSNDVPTLPLGLERKPGRGRPPGSKNKNSPINLGVEKKERVSSAPDPDALESAKFIGAAVVSLVELMENFTHNSCENRIEKKRPEKLSEFREMLLQFKMKEKEKHLVADSTAKIAARYDWMTSHAPEVVLGVTLAQYSLRQMSLLKFVKGQTEDRPNIPQAPVEPKKE